MDEIILKYLNKHYRMTIDDFFDGHMYDRYGIKYVSSGDITLEIKEIFSEPLGFLIELVDDWWEEKEEFHKIGIDKDEEWKI